MKKKLVLFTIIVFLVQCAPKRAMLDLKDYKSIEGVKIGMKINSAIDMVKSIYYIEKTEISNYGENFEYIVYGDISKKLKLFSFNSGNDPQTVDKVFRLAVKHPKYQTADGVKVGMTLKELKERTKLKLADFDFENGLFLISDSFDGGFLMDLSTINDDNYNYEEPQIELLPEELKIKEIILF